MPVHGIFANSSPSTKDSKYVRETIFHAVSQIE